MFFTWRVSHKAPLSSQRATDHDTSTAALWATGCPTSTAPGTAHPSFLLCPCLACERLQIPYGINMAADMCRLSHSLFLKRGLTISLLAILLPGYPECRDTRLCIDLTVKKGSCLHLYLAALLLSPHPHGRPTSHHQPCHDITISALYAQGGRLQASPPAQDCGKQGQLC